MGLVNYLQTFKLLKIYNMPQNNHLSMFEQLGAILNPSKLEFIQVFVCPDYAVITLQNGNISECVRYLRELVGTGLTGMKDATDQISKIKHHFPESYEYIIDKVYSFR